MNPRITIGVLAVLVVLAALVFGLERLDPGQSQAQGASKDEQLTIFQFDDDQVTAFTGRLGDRTVRLEKVDESAWRIAETGEPANRFQLTSVLVSMSQMRGTKRAESAPNLAEFGLAEPRLEATVELENGETHTLQIGDRSPIGTNVYAKKPGSDEVFVIGSTFAQNVERLINEPKEPPTPTPRPTGTPTPEPSPTPEGTPKPGS